MRWIVKQTIYFFPEQCQKGEQHEQETINRFTSRLTPEIAWYFYCPNDVDLYGLPTG
jgi:hypothetical protein